MTRSEAGGNIEWQEVIFFVKFLPANIQNNFGTAQFAPTSTDHIALPSKGGAMENWGLVTYGERSLLWTQEWSNSASLRGTAGVIAHELAHMVSALVSAVVSACTQNSGQALGRGKFNPNIHKFVDE